MNETEQTAQNVNKRLDNVEADLWKKIEEMEFIQKLQGNHIDFLLNAVLGNNFQNLNTQYSTQLISLLNANARENDTGLLNNVIKLKTNVEVLAKFEQERIDQRQQQQKQQQLATSAPPPANKSWFSKGGTRKRRRL